MGFGSRRKTPPASPGRKECAPCTSSPPPPPGRGSGRGRSRRWIPEGCVPPGRFFSQGPGDFSEGVRQGQRHGDENGPRIASGDVSQQRGAHLKPEGIRLVERAAIQLLGQIVPHRVAHSLCVKQEAVRDPGVQRLRQGSFSHAVGAVDLEDHLSTRLPSRASSPLFSRRWRRYRPNAPGQRGCTGRTFRPRPSSGFHIPRCRTTWS